MEELLLNANVAYLLLVAGFMLAILALLAPGTGILEVVALFALLLAGWSVTHLIINYWALIILLIGVIPFLFAVRKTRRLEFLGLTILALVVGSTFLFRGAGWLPAVNPILALVVSVITGGFLWIAVTKTLEASLVRPEHDLSRLVGRIGNAKTIIYEEGSVQVDGELWSARSEIGPSGSARIPKGSRVRVIGRDGFILIVEEVIT
jgi:membrane-bound ClpP family serine protease